MRTSNKLLGKHIVASLILGTLITTSSINTVNAVEMGSFVHDSKHTHKRMKRMAKHLELTDSQIEQIKSIKSGVKANSTDLRSQMKSFKEQIKSLIDASTFDEQAFNAAYLQYQDTFAQLALNKAKTRHAMYQVLTTEQQEKWQTFMENKKEKRKAGQGRL